MVELKSNNLFLMSGEGSVYTITKILDFLDLIGKNIVYFNDSKTSLTSLQKFKSVSFSRSDFPDKIKDNIFRAELIVIESEKARDVLYHSRLRTITDIPVIWISHSLEWKFNISDFDYIYKMSKKKENISTVAQLLTPNHLNIKDTLDTYIVEDVKGGWKSNLKDLRVQYIRNKNIEDILGE